MSLQIPLLHGTGPEDGPGILAWVVLVAGVVLAACGLRAGPRRREGLAYFLAGCVAASLGGVAVLGARPRPNEELSRNPILPTLQSVSAGQRVYEVHCATCHGPQGAGDGPASASLPKRPADLRVHVPMHPDGQLFLLISRGIPGSHMPGFSDRLTDEERWHVVNYLRLLAISSR